MYILKEYNTPIATFELSKNNDSRCRVSNLKILNKELLPLGMDFTNEGVALWLKQRIIPKNRGYVDNILSRFGISYRETIAIINICKVLSLNDSYWVVDENFEGDFSKYNIYQNKINNSISKVALTGYGDKGRISKDIISPEFTTNGMLAKCWRRINGKLYLYKAATIEFDGCGKEPYSEFYAYQIAKTMGLDIVEYNIKKLWGNICSTCEIFTDIDHSYIPIGRMIKNCTIEKVLEYYKNLGEEYYNSLISMFVFDAIICNTDRHFGNFGLIIDNSTNTICKTAPIFDNGLSLFNYALDNELNNAKEYSKTRYPAAYDNFVDFVKPLMSEVQKKQVRKLINFKFKKHPRYNLDSKRLKNIENFIQVRIKELLD